MGEMRDREAVLRCHPSDKTPLPRARSKQGWNCWCRDANICLRWGQGQCIFGGVDNGCFVRKEAVTGSTDLGPS